LAMEMLVIVVRDSDPENRIYFNNLRMYDGQPGCLSECLHIAEEGSGFRFNDDESVYVEVNAPAEERAPGLYCRDGSNEPGQNGGTDLHSGFNPAIHTGFLSIPYLPECLLITKLSDTTYSISLQEGAEEFAFSSLYQDLNDDTLFCVYPTHEPRCAQFYGSLRYSNTAEMHCDEEPAGLTCIGTVYEKFCQPGDGILCGQKRTVRQMLECCTKDNFDPASCTGYRRRRLNENLRISATEVIDGAQAERCASYCYQNMDGTDGESGCLGWRIGVDWDGQPECKLAKKCYASSQTAASDFEKQKWHLLRGSNPFDGVQTLVKVYN